MPLFSSAPSHPASTSISSKRSPASSSKPTPAAIGKPRTTRHSWLIQFPPPGFLPNLHSKKWQSRKARDPIGYLRVQHLSQDHSTVDWLHIFRHLRRHERRHGSIYVTDQESIIEARRLLERMHQMSPNASQSANDFANQLDEAWISAMALIDGFLEAEHQAHLTAVRKGGASGI